MLARFAISVFLGSAVTLSLLFVMQTMVTNGRSSNMAIRSVVLDDFIGIERSQVVEPVRRRPERPASPEVPPKLPMPEPQGGVVSAVSVSVPAPSLQTDIQVAAVGFRAADGDFLPVVKVSPVYPTRALARGLEGYVLVEFTVTSSGSVRDVSVVESTASLFEKPAIEAALKFKYKPRIAGGAPIEVRGVRNKILFEMEVLASSRPK